MTACVLLALLSTVVFGAEVFRSTDRNGNVTFSDRRQNENDVPVVIATPRPATPAPQPAAKPAETAPQAAAPAVAMTETVQPTAQERAEQRTKNCSTARERLENYTTSHRLYRETAGGEREYLSSAEIDEARARAAADVETWCD